jgi:hypothetical protein
MENCCHRKKEKLEKIENVKKNRFFRGGAAQELAHARTHGSGSATAGHT